MNAAATHATAVFGKIDDILDLSRNKLSQVPDRMLTTSERWMRYLGFPLGIAVFLALPAAFTIDWVIGLPINAKPNVILFATGQYSVLDNLKYGLIMTTIGTILLIIAGFTWFRVLGITPGL